MRFTLRNLIRAPKITCECYKGNVKMSCRTARILYLSCGGYLICSFCGLHDFDNKHGHIVSKVFTRLE